LKNAAQSYSDADKLLEKTHDALEGMLAPDPAELALENDQSLLRFTAETNSTAPAGSKKSA